MQYAVLEEVHITVNSQTQLTVVWSDVGPVHVAPTVEAAHTWLVNNGYQPDPYEAPPSELRGLFEHYYRLIPVVML